MSKASEWVKAKPIFEIDFCGKTRIAYVNDEAELQLVNDTCPLHHKEALALADWIKDTFGESDG